MADSVNQDRESVPSAEEQARAQEFLKTTLQTYERYHNHKESMAYTGFTFYAALFGAAILAPAWPRWSTPITVSAASTAWVFFILYLGWQLRLRRLASIRVAGIERLLAQWITTPPSRALLQPLFASPTVQRPRRRLLRALSQLWPLRRILPDSDLPHAVYPRALVDAWERQAEDRGTDAMFHERLLFAAGWLLYLAVLARALGLWTVAAKTQL